MILINNKLIRRNFKLAFIFSVIIILFTSCSIDTGQGQINEKYDSPVNISDKNGTGEGKARIEDYNTSINSSKSDFNKPKEVMEEDEKVGITIKTVGDILYHSNLVDYGRYASQSDDYDFTDHFALIKDFIGHADVTIGNFEGTSNPNLETGGYPRFNIPDDIFITLKEVGFDALSTANNHALDTDIEGINTTIEAINDSGLKSFGTQNNNHENYTFFDVKGVKIAFLSYTESLNGLGYLLDNPEKEKMINLLNEDDIKEDIENVNKQGADLVIVYPHWGEEYSPKPLQKHINLARNMIEWGADVICGNHPHVVQPTEWYTSSDGRKGFIIYSMGNFISDQNLESVGILETEQSVVVEISFEKNLTKNIGNLKDVAIHPTWLYKHYDENGFALHQTVLAEEYKKNGSKAQKLSDENMERATMAYEMTMKKIRENID